MAKFCYKCGAQLKETSKFCPICGTKTRRQETAPDAAHMSQQTQQSGYSQQPVVQPRQVQYQPQTARQQVAQPAQQFVQKATQPIKQAAQGVAGQITQPAQQMAQGTMGYIAKPAQQFVQSAGNFSGVANVFHALSNPGEAAMAMPEMSVTSTVTSAVSGGSLPGFVIPLILGAVAGGVSIPLLNNLAAPWSFVAGLLVSGVSLGISFAVKKLRGRG